MFVHGLDADCWHDQGGAGAGRRADEAEQVGPGEPPVAPDTRTRAALGPDAGQRALLANAGFILKPDFDRPVGKLLRDCGARQLSEVLWDGPPLRPAALLLPTIRKGGRSQMQIAVLGIDLGKNS